MPKVPVTYCRCGRRKRGGSLCRECQRRKLQRLHDSVPDSERKLYRMQAWKKLRQLVLDQQPWCATPGCSLPAVEVDHITPRSRGGDFWDRDNLQGLCRGCHRRKSAREAGPARAGTPRRGAGGRSDL